MIPKVIHYCWFGGKKKPHLVKKCIKSWKKYAPDYQIIEWNESNFDVHCIKYCEEAYQLKKWAFVSDVARIFVLLQNGGFYLDTDYELTRPIDDLCKLDFFTGFENKTQIGFGIFGASKNNPILSKWFDSYKLKNFLVDNKMNMQPIGLFFMQVFNYKELQNDNNIFFTNEYFYSPRKNKVSYGIHHYQASWYTKKEKFIKFLGPRFTKLVVKIKHLFKKR